MGQCNVLPSQPTITTFVASLHIPVGYVLVPENLYALHLTLDSSNLKVDTTVELKPSTIIIDDSNPANPLTIQCESKIYKLLLHGVIYYNIVVERFQTAQTLDNTKYTAFSTNDVIQMDTSLGYSCYECELPPLPENLYSVEVTKGTEFVITNDASIIPYNILEPDPFFNALRNAGSSQTIQVPYTLTIKSLI